MSKPIFTVDSYEDGAGQWRGVITNNGDDVIFATKQAYGNARRAETYAVREFNKALYECNHEWDEWSDEQALDTEFGGIEYVRQQDCKKCELTRYDFSDRSMHDSDRDY